MNARALTWEKSGASAGIASVLLLAIGYAITSTTSADLSGTDADYVRALLSERFKWEWVTFVRLVAGILMLWFMESLAGRMRRLERESGRLGTVLLGLGIVWAAVWLLSAFFNSASILLAANYGESAGSRIGGILARETPLVLTGSIMIAILLATSSVALRFGGFPKAYTYGTAALIAPFCIIVLLDWWFPEINLGSLIVSLALLWTATTSVVLARPRAESHRLPS